MIAIRSRREETKEELASVAQTFQLGLRFAVIVLVALRENGQEPVFKTPDEVSWFSGA